MTLQRVVHTVCRTTSRHNEVHGGEHSSTRTRRKSVKSPREVRQLTNWASIAHSAPHPARATSQQLHRLTILARPQVSLVCLHESTGTNDCSIRPRSQGVVVAPPAPSWAEPTLQVSHRQWAIRRQFLTSNIRIESCSRHIPCLGPTKHLRPQAQSEPF